MEWLTKIAEPSIWWIAGIAIPIVIVWLVNKKLSFTMRKKVKQYLPTVLDEVAKEIDGDDIDFPHEERVTKIIRKVAKKVREDVDVTSKDEVKLEKYIEKKAKKKVPK